MPDITITVNVPDGAEHVCSPTGDCPTALARAQEAIDEDRELNRIGQRPLSQRLHAMRNAAPSPRWFEHASMNAHLLEREIDTWRASSQTSADVAPVDALSDTIVDTLQLLERAGLIPRDREYIGHAVNQFIVKIGSSTFEAKVVETSRDPEYIVTLSPEVPDAEPTKRSTLLAEDVRAWMVAWAAEVAWR